MDRLVDDGFIVVGGPLGNGDRTLHLVAADGAGQIEARMAQDPWAAMRLLEIGSIEPWALWLDGRAWGGWPRAGAGPGRLSPDLARNPLRLRGQCVVSLRAAAAGERSRQPRSVTPVTRRRSSSDRPCHRPDHLNCSWSVG